MAAFRLAVVGAESTGKSTLAQALADRIGRELGLRACAVPEALRDSCAARGRTPARHEQWEIARLQQEGIDAAAGACDVVVADTTSLMTSVYSELVFADLALDERARADHAGIGLTLLTATDLPWVADGLQRDGPHVRAPVDRLVRERLARWSAPWALVTGSGPARTECAWDALRAALAAWSRDGHGPPALADRLQAAATGPRRWQPLCEFCDDPHCEHRLRLAREPR